MNRSSRTGILPNLQNIPHDKIDRTRTIEVGIKHTFYRKLKKNFKYILKFTCAEHFTFRRIVVYISSKLRGHHCGKTSIVARPGKEDVLFWIRQENVIFRFKCDGNISLGQTLVTSSGFPNFEGGQYFRGGNNFYDQYFQRIRIGGRSKKFRGSKFTGVQNLHG